MQDQNLNWLEANSRIYEHFPLPVTICSQEFSVVWSNAMAKSHYPEFAGTPGISALLSGYEPDLLLQRLAREGCCTITGELPFGGIRVCLLPVFGDGTVLGAVCMLISATTVPGPHDPDEESRTAGALNATLRGSVEAIFNVMDNVALKADLMHMGWVKSAFRHIGAVNYHILRVTDNIGAFLNFQSGKQEPDFRTVDLADLLLEVQDTVTAIGASMNIPIEFELDRLPCPIRADRAILELALFNVIHNSLFFTSPGNRVKVSVSREDRGVCLAVSDRGLGIPEKFLPQVWRPYSSFTHKGKGDGVGLGLALVKAAVEAHQGTCAIVSRVGEGTTVTLRFPSASLSSAMELAHDSGHRMDERFSRLYIGLGDACLSPYLEF